MISWDKRLCRALAFGVIVAGWVGLAVVPAGANTSLSWNTFRGDPGWSDGLNLACSHPDSSYRLVATFATPEAVPEFEVLEARVVLGYPSGYPPLPLPALSPFWHFEQGGCNEGWMVLGDTKPPGGADVVTLWGSGGQFVDAFLQYAPDTPIAGRGRFRVTMVRQTPASLEVDRPYFAFTLDLVSCAASSCAGCGEAIGVEFADAFLYGADGQVVAVADLGGEGYVCANPGPYCSVVAADATPRDAEISDAAFLPVPKVDSMCDPTPARHRTWGELKVLYR